MTSAPPRCSASGRDRPRRTPRRGRRVRRCGDARRASSTMSSRSHDDATWAANSPTGGVDLSAGRPVNTTPEASALSRSRSRRASAGTSSRSSAPEAGEQAAGAGDAAQERHDAVAGRQRAVDVERGDEWASARRTSCQRHCHRAAICHDPDLCPNWLAGSARSTAAASPSRSAPTPSCSTSAAATSRTGGPTSCSIVTSAPSTAVSVPVAPRPGSARPLFAADAADMPFADGVFDYVVCSHVLEHVTDPAAVIAEITRVGRAGYIEVPQAASAKILDFPSHLWWCRLDGSTLVFTAKHARAFDPEIAGYIERSGVERELERLLDRAFDYRDRVLALGRERRRSRRGDARPAVRGDGALGGGPPSPRSDARRPDAHGDDGAPPSAAPPQRPVLFDDVVKPELRTGTGERLQKRLYDLPSKRVVGRPEARPALADDARDRRRRSRRRRRRARRTPSPAGGRGGCAARHRAARRHRPATGSTWRPSAVSSMRAPVRASSRARSPSRSLSLARMNPTPRIVVGVDAVDGDRGDRRHEVGRRRHVDVDAAQRPSRVRLTVTERSSDVDVTAHRREQLDDRDVALHRRRA